MNDEVREFVKLTERSLVNVGLGLFPQYLSTKCSPLHHELSNALVNEDESVVFAFPREFGKSTFCWTLKTAWNIIHRKYRYIVFITDSAEKGKKQFLSTRKDVLAHPLLKGMIVKKGRETSTELELITLDPKTGEQFTMYIAVYGSNQNLRGLRMQENRPDLIILDDVEDTETSRSEEQRAKMKEWFFADVLPLGKMARIFFVGTMVHEDCLFASLLREPPLDTKTEKPWKTFKFGVLDDDGNPTWPEKYDMKWIDTTRRNFIQKGQLYRFNTEYMNVAVGRDDRIFSPESVQFYSLAQYKAASTGGMDIITTVDLGMKLKMDNDPSAILTTGMDSLGNIWLLDLIMRRMRKSDILDAILATYKRWNPRNTFIEAVQGQEYLVQDLEDGRWRGEHQMPFERIDTKQVALGKELRIGNLEDIFAQKKILVPAMCPWWADFVNEIVSFPRGAHDEILDCLGYAKMNHVKLGKFKVDIEKLRKGRSSTVF